MQNTIITPYISPDIFKHIICYVNSYQEVFSICTLNRETYESIHQNENYWQFLVKNKFGDDFRQENMSWYRMYGYFILNFLETCQSVLASCYSRSWNRVPMSTYRYFIYLPSGKYIEYSCNDEDGYDDYKFRNSPHMSDFTLYQLEPTNSKEKEILQKYPFINNFIPFYGSKLINAITRVRFYNQFYLFDIKNLIPYIQAINTGDTYNCIIDELYDILGHNGDRIYQRDKDEYIKEYCIQDEEDDYDPREHYFDSEDDSE